MILGGGSAFPDAALCHKTINDAVECQAIIEARTDQRPHPLCMIRSKFWCKFHGHLTVLCVDENKIFRVDATPVCRQVSGRSGYKRQKRERSHQMKTCQLPSLQHATGSALPLWPKRSI